MLRTPRVTPPGSPTRSARSAASGWNCSKRLPRTSRGSCACTRRVQAICVRSKRPRNHWGASRCDCGQRCQRREGGDRSLRSRAEWGLIPTPGVTILVPLELARLAAQYHLPSSSTAAFAAAGGLIGYGGDIAELYG